MAAAFPVSAKPPNYLAGIGRPLAEVCVVLAAAVWRVNPMASSVYLAGSEMYLVRLAHRTLSPPRGPCPTTTPCKHRCTLLEVNVVNGSVLRLMWPVLCSL
ncbi:hypothetical protein TREES_T100000391 [Tupaia chinensis]|uniref:Uncharacterized protein n=1 Tax=Tupaia chinensis TaxID=246437 RepID=L9KWD0_TUPCH|nr:hypothetical protein TREES_T100000391 [Tupaia chinensis]